MRPACMAATLLMLLLASALPLAAEDLPLASYWANSGSLPPQYAWDVTITISEGGDTEIRYCTGYEMEGPGCKTATARLDAAALAAIRQAALASGLATSPAQEVPHPMVGGSTRGGTVWLDKQKITLPAQPVAADVPRVQSVLEAIISALPEGLMARVMPGN